MRSNADFYNNFCLFMQTSLAAAKSGGRKMILTMPLALAAFILFQPNVVRAQCVSLTLGGSAYTQNFDTLSNTAGSTTNNLTIPGWFLTETGGGARDNEQYAVDTGGSNTGDTYSYGAAGETERALGGLQTGTLIPTFGACFTNNTGSSINSLNISYSGEQWRIGNTAAARDDRLDFQYSLNATDLTTGTWTDVNTLDFTNPIKTSTVAGALDGNAAANRTALTSSIPALNIAAGATFWIRWNDLNASGADDGLAVDDFSLTPQVTTAASVILGGRILTADGRGISNARVSLTDSQGQTRIVSSSSFGYFRFADVAVGDTYFVTVSSKRFTFNTPTRVIALTADVTDLEFVADN